MSDTKFKVESNVPIPKMVSGRGALKYPFDLMKVGDSFEVEYSLYKSVANAASVYGRLHNMSFIVRTIWQGTPGMSERRARVWRVR